jgi:uncharacterized coiled-coil protein SlyX
MTDRDWWLPRVLVPGVFVLAAIAGSAWLYSETRDTQQEAASEIAQLKLSLELYGRQYTASATSMSELNATLKGLESRLAGLEENLAALSAAPGGSVDALTQRLSALEDTQIEEFVEETVVPEPRPSSQARTAENRTDCVSQNSPFLVAAGDIFPICGTSGWVAVADVGEQRISFRSLGRHQLHTDGALGQCGLAGRLWRVAGQLLAPVSHPTG